VGAIPSEPWLAKQYTLLKLITTYIGKKID
jgi:hypothetical protein